MNDSTVGRVLFYAFAISVLLVVVVYFVGLSTDLGTASDAVRSLVYAITGRDTSGQFAGYPGGATLQTTNTATGSTRVMAK